MLSDYCAWTAPALAGAENAKKPSPARLPE